MTKYVKIMTDDLIPDTLNRVEANNSEYEIYDIRMIFGYLHTGDSYCKVTIPIGTHLKIDNSHAGSIAECNEIILGPEILLTVNEIIRLRQNGSYLTLQMLTVLCFYMKEIMERWTKLPDEEKYLLRDYLMNVHHQGTYDLYPILLKDNQTSLEYGADANDIYSHGFMDVSKIPPQIKIITFGFEFNQTIVGKFNDGVETIIFGHDFSNNDRPLDVSVFNLAHAVRIFNDNDNLELVGTFTPNMKSVYFGAYFNNNRQKMERDFEIAKMARNYLNSEFMLLPKVILNIIINYAFDDNSSLFDLRIFNEGIKRIAFGMHFNLELRGRFPSSLEYVSFGSHFENNAVQLNPKVFPKKLKSIVISPKNMHLCAEITENGWE